ncbi:hypothetical protein [Fluviispira multicolorata]|uniref:Uncharacterized protein n=1 Tax=Fluviispira multicolorata TaxID=2654512 RepID=A0A833N566_9BACT|nr:hypothetical protein [Fluviispira multicolorata]KAB8029867.1 hypothetical protein GCL57_10030 [Fluviispira multicolorata]
MNFKKLFVLVASILFVYFAKSEDLSNSTVYLSARLKNTIFACGLDDTGAIVNCKATGSELKGPDGPLSFYKGYAYLPGSGADTKNDNTTTKCQLNIADSTLSNCTGQVNKNFASPHTIHFFKKYAYITSYASNSIYLCQTDKNYSLDSCVQTGNSFNKPLEIAIAKNNAYITNFGDQSVSLCRINNDGTFASPCTKMKTNAGTNISLANNYAYITNQLKNSVDVCPIQADGNFGVCSNMPIKTLSQVRDIMIYNKYSYITNWNNSIITKCEVNSNSGNLENCGTMDLSKSVSAPISGISILDISSKF